jgi:FtsZ-interacting cell division protein ZipA
MNTNRKRIASAAVSVALVGGVIVGALALGSNMAAAEPSPTPTSTFGPASLVEFRETVDEAIEAQRLAAEAEAARVEAERVAAEQAAADQAARDAAARQSAPQAPAPQAPAAPAPQAPAPAPAPPAPPAPGGGDQQAGECREYNDANECTAWYAP